MLATSVGNEPQMLMNRLLIGPIHDQITKDNKILKLIWAKQESFAGKSYDIPFAYKETSWWASFNWLDTFATNYDEVLANMSFTPSWFQKEIVLAWTDLSIAATGWSVVPFFTQRVELEVQSASKKFTRQILGDWTWNSWKDFLGFVAGCDDWTNVAVYGGHDRTAGSWTPWDILKGNLDDTSYTTGGTPFSLAAFRSLFDDCSNWDAKPDLNLCWSTVYNIIESLMPTVTLYSQPSLSADELRGPDNISVPSVYAGHKKMYYNGAAIVEDKMLDTSHSTKMFVLNTDTWIFPTVKMVGSNWMELVKQAITSNTITWGFDMSGAEMSQWGSFALTDFVYNWKQYAYIANLLLGGQFICKFPRYNGYFSDIQG